MTSIGPHCLLQVVISLAQHFHKLEGEKEKLSLQISRLCQENKWLRDELESTRVSLQDSEQRVVQLIEEKEHLAYMNSLKQFDKADEVRIQSVFNSVWCRLSWVLYGWKVDR